MKAADIIIIIAALAMIIGYAAGALIFLAAALFFLGKWAWGWMTPI